MISHRELSVLRDVLANIYYREPDVTRLVTCVGLNPSFIAWDERPINTWHSILSEVERRGKLDDLLGFVVAERPEDMRLKQLVQELQTTSSSQSELTVTFSARQRHLSVQAQELNRHYDVLTRRIAAIETDIGRELDSLRKQTLEERRQEFAAERDHIISELEKIEQQMSD